MLDLIITTGVCYDENNEKAVEGNCLENYVTEFIYFYCAVPENIHTHPMEGQWKFQGDGGSQRPKF